MDQQKRLLVALALAFALTAVYMVLNPSKPLEGQADAGMDASVELADAGVAAQKPQVAQVPQVQVDGGAPAAAVPSPPALPPAEVKILSRTFPDVHYSLSTRGAGLVKAQFQGEKMREQRPLSAKQGYKLLLGGEVPDSPQMDMALPPEAFPPALAVGVKGASALDPWLTWSLDEKASSDQTLVFVARSGTWEARKTLSFAQSDGDASRAAAHGYELGMRVELKNISASPATGELGVHYTRAADPKHEEKGSLLGGVGNESKSTCVVKEDMQSLTPGQDALDAEKLTGPIAFVGVDQQYFLGAVFPLDAARDGRCELEATPTGRSAVGYFPITVQPGETLVRHYGVYVGPKDTDLLTAEPTAQVAAAAGVQRPAFPVHLSKTVNFGIWEFICVVLLGILKFFHAVFGNWGLAIVFLTVTIKTALLPLTYKSMVSAENMKKLTPKMTELKKKFAGDRERLNMEMMKLYQQEKVNPVGGCFPMLLQMPVWIALYATLRNSYEIYREPFFGPVWTDLTYKDPTYLFPLLLGITMIMTQRLQPSIMDASQQKLMTWIMPIMFTGMMLFYPAGLTLYIFTNNVLSIAQQFAIRRIIQKRGGGTPAPAKA